MIFLSIDTLMSIRLVYSIYRYIDEYTTRPVDVASVSVNRVKFKAIQHCFEIIGFKPEVRSSRKVPWKGTHHKLIRALPS